MNDFAAISDKLWTAADKLRANSGIMPSEYARPVLGLLFLRHADKLFTEVEAKLSSREGSRVRPSPEAYKSQGAIYLPPEARFSFLLQLPEGSNLGRALTTAMREIEAKNPELTDVLPKSYQSIPDMMFSLSCCENSSRCRSAVTPSAMSMSTSWATSPRRPCRREASSIRLRLSFG